MVTDRVECCSAKLDDSLVRVNKTIDPWLSTDLVDVRSDSPAVSPGSWSSIKITFSVAMCWEH